MAKRKLMSKEEREYYIKRNAKEKRKEENLEGIGKFIFFAAIVVLIFVFDWEKNSAILICSYGSCWMAYFI